MNTHDLARKLLNLPNSVICPQIRLPHKKGIPLSTGGNIRINYKRVSGFNDDYDYLDLIIVPDKQYLKTYGIDLKNY
jgi:hypothetical protein